MYFVDNFLLRSRSESKKNDDANFVDGTSLAFRTMESNFPKLEKHINNSLYSLKFDHNISYVHHLQNFANDCPIQKHTNFQCYFFQICFRIGFTIGFYNL